MTRKLRARLVPAALCVCALAGCASAAPRGLPVAQQEKLLFNDIWGYVLQGKEDELTGQEPLTRICYFAASLSKDGRITDSIARPALATRNGFKPEIHLVIEELSNSSLVHFALSPAYGIRPLLVDDICRVSDPFDGVQIDFEAVSPDDAQNFWDFLHDLRNRLPAKKMLSVAVPARTSPVADAYVYSKIAAIADRVMIMAYDEHWSSGPPGPVASLPWCSAVLAYAQSVMDNGKIVMGLPLYGRAWPDKRLARALRYQGVQDIMAEKNVKPDYQSDLGSYFEYSENVQVKVFYDDLRSITDKLQLYSSKNVGSVAFWRIGLGPAELWNSIDNSRDESAAALGFAADSQY